MVIHIAIDEMSKNYGPVQMKRPDYFYMDLLCTAPKP